MNDVTKWWTNDLSFYKKPHNSRPIHELTSISYHFLNVKMFSNCPSILDVWRVIYLLGIRIPTESWQIVKIIINMKSLFSEKFSCIIKLKDEIKYFSTQMYLLL